MAVVALVVIEEVDLLVPVPAGSLSLPPPPPPDMGPPPATEAEGTELLALCPLLPMLGLPEEEELVGAAAAEDFVRPAAVEPISLADRWWVRVWSRWPRSKEAEGDRSVGPGLRGRQNEVV